MVVLEKLEELVPSNEVLKVISETKPINIKINNGTVNRIKRTNIKSIDPIIYELTYGSGTLIIWQYPVNEIKGNNFYIPDNKNTYSLLEIKTMLSNY